MIADMMKVFKYDKYFDTVVVIIYIYCSSMFFKGFSLSLISFSKWILSTVVTIIMVPTPTNS